MSINLNLLAVEMEIDATYFLIGLLALIVRSNLQHTTFDMNCGNLLSQILHVMIKHYFREEN